MPAATIDVASSMAQSGRRPSLMGKMSKTKSRSNTSTEVVETVDSKTVGSDAPHLDLEPLTAFQPFGSPTGSKKHRRRSSKPATPIERARTTSILVDTAMLSGTPITRRSSDQNHPTVSDVNETPSPSSDVSPWIGGTGLGSAGLGKSGRVIERLMAENDRLSREMKAEIAKREELQRTLQTQKPKLEGLQTENSRLSNIKAMDDNIIKRRDRKIEELRNELQVERTKREAFESQALNAERRREELEESTKKDILAANEKERHASSHAEILQTSHERLSSEYRQRTTTIHKALRELGEDKEHDRKKLAKMDIVANQMRQESERMRKIHAEMISAWNRFEHEKTEQVEELEDDIRHLKGLVAEKTRMNETLSEEMQDVVGQMRWVMRLKKLHTDEGIDSPPPSPPT